VHHRHAKSLGADSHSLTNPSESDDPELFTPQLGAIHEIEGPALPSASPDHAFAFAEPARDRQHERQREVRGCLGQDPWRVRNDNAASACGLHVDVVVTHRHRGDDPQIASALEHGTVNGIGQHADERLLASDSSDKLGARHAVLTVESVDIARPFEQFHCCRREPAREQNGWLDDRLLQ